MSPLPSASTVESASAIDEATPPLGNDGVWVLRFRNPAGKMCRARAHTEQIVLRLRRGRLSAKVEARHARGGDYHPLSFYPEFKDVSPSRPPPKQPAKFASKSSEAAPSPAAARWWHRHARLLLFAVGSVVLLLFLVVFFFYLNR
jgi:hypothetical protein